jgi:hypothetical protein
MRAKCVFSELVKSDDDAEGILAYGVYKYKKLEEAKSLSKTTKSPEEIQNQLNEYHDRFFDNQYEMGKAKDAATIILNALRENLASAHQKEIERITSTHRDEVTKLKKEEAKRQKAAIRKDRDEWIAKVDKTRLADHNILTRLFLFAWSGVPSAVATFGGYLLFTFLLIALFTKPEDREARYNEATEKGREFFKIDRPNNDEANKNQPEK